MQIICPSFLTFSFFSYTHPKHKFYIFQSLEKVGRVDGKPQGFKGGKEVESFFFFLSTTFLIY